MLQNSFLPKTRQQIADDYGFTYKTLMNRLKKRDIQLPSGLVLPNLQKQIYEELGYPNREIKTVFEKY